jgi:hypothetical protein
MRRLARRAGLTLLFPFRRMAIIRELLRSREVPAGRGAAAGTAGYRNG